MAAADREIHCARDELGRGQTRAARCAAAWSLVSRQFHHCPKQAMEVLVGVLGNVVTGIGELKH